MRNAVAALVLAALFATTAAAGNGISSISVVKHRSLTSCAIKAYVSGDDDSSAVLRIFQRWTGDNYDTGMVMVRREGSTIHEGRILWMTPGRTAQFYIEAVDATSGTTTTTADTVSCAVIRQMPAGGTLYYVNQATGLNSNSGLTAASPKRTFNTYAAVDGGGAGALAALLAADTPNSGIIVAPGEYHEKLSITSGTDGYFHFIMGSSASPDSTIICGANIHGEAQRRDISNAFSWTADGNCYRTHLQNTECATCYGDSIGSVTVGWGEWLHKKTSLKALVEDSSGTVGGADLSIGRIGHGWWYQNDTLYVRRSSGASPSGISMHIGYLGALIDVRKRNWRISRLTVRFAGGPIDQTYLADEDPENSTYEGIVFGLNANGSGGVVDSCLFYGNSAAGVNARYSSAGNVADSVTIANSRFDGLRLGTMGYSASKARIDENTGGIICVGRESNVYKNTLTEVANGIQTSPVNSSQDSTYAQNMEVANNVLTTYADDGIETDATHALNQLIVGNRTMGGSSGISTTTIYMPSGPMFIIENQFLQFRSAGIKIGDGTRCKMPIYQNTFASQIPPTVAGVSVRAFEGASGGSVDNVEAYNNIWFSPGNTSVGTIAMPSLTANTTNRFNYNLVYGAPLANLVSGNGGPYTWTTWKATGMEANGINDWPRFSDLSRGNVRPHRSSPVVGAGRRITGVNTSLSGPRYVGSPHIGALTCPTCRGLPR